MKKIAFIFICLLWLPLQACAESSEPFEEGKHYKVLKEPLSDKPEIIEFFSFWCGHCYNFEPLFQEIKAKAGSDVKIQKVHVNFMGSTTKEAQDNATRAMLVAKAMKNDDVVVSAIFNAIHRARANLATNADFRKIFVANGADAAEFDKLSASFGVNGMFVKNGNVLQQYRPYVSGVPNFIVNGKYQATFTRDMTPEDMINLILWLSKKRS